MMELNVFTKIAENIFVILSKVKELLVKIPIPIEVTLLTLAFLGAWYVNNKMYRWGWIVLGVVLFLLLLKV